MKRALISFISALVVLMALALPVFADGQYGQYGTTTEQPSEQPKEEVTHQTVEAGLGDNLLVVAAVAGGVAMLSFIVSKMTARVYLLDK